MKFTAKDLNAFTAMTQGNADGAYPEPAKP